MSRNDDDNEPLFEWPWELLDKIPRYWHYIMAVIGALAGPFIALHFGYKPLQGFVVGGVVGLLFFGLLAKVLELTSFLLLAAAVVLIAWYVFFKP